jgi:hypothetical protein
MLSGFSWKRSRRTGRLREDAGARRVWRRMPTLTVKGHDDMILGLRGAADSV